MTPVVLGGMVALLVVIAVAWPVARWPELMALWAETASLGGALLLARRRRVRAAVWLGVLTFIASSAVVVLSFGSLRTVGTFGFVFAIILAAVYLPRRDIALATVLTWLVLAALTWVEVSRPEAVPVRPYGWPHTIMIGMGLLFVVFVVGYSREVAVRATRRQQAELEERRWAEQQLRLSMEATRQGWFDLDLRTGRVTSSDQFASLIGAAKQGTGMPMTRDGWLGAVHFDDRPAVLERFERCLRTGATEQMEYRLKAFDGSFRWIRSIAKVVQYDADGTPLRMSGTHADVTEQMATTLALQASERGYRALVEMSPVGVIVLRDGTVRYANSAAVRALGATDGEALVGMLMRRFVPAESEAALAAMCELASRNEVPSEAVEQRLCRLDGETFEASIRCTVAVFEGASSLQLSFTDISLRKRADESRLRSRQLEALGTLAGGIAHDFNNIVFAIRGNAELVADDPRLSPDSAEHVHEILMAGQRASELVRRITGFARPKEPLRERVELPDVLREALRLLRPTIPAGISQDIVVTGEVPAIYADAAQLHEAIVNLTTNAAYAIGPARVGSIVYTVDSVEVDAALARELEVEVGRYSRLSVRDTGAGMDSATQQRIFDAFFTTKPVGEGSGLGLSMVYGTMRSHSGAVTVDSRPGEGATFRLLFPVATDMAAPARVPPATMAAPSPVRVLFVDDEPQLVRLAERTLGRLGHEVTSFSDPIHALEAFREAPQQFDVVITDLSMPRLSGLDLTRALRDVRGDVPVIMVTGYADGADEDAARAAGVTRVAVKAADANQLARLLAQVLPAPSSAATAPVSLG